MMKPMIFLCSHRAPETARGPGRILSMSVTNQILSVEWVGVVHALALPRPLEVAYGRGLISMEDAKRLYRTFGQTEGLLAPGDLQVCCAGIWGLVEPGDTVIDGFTEEGREMNPRAWAAEMLAEAGWDVVLDGRQLS